MRRSKLNTHGLSNKKKPLSIVGSTGTDQFSVVDDRDPVAEKISLVHEVRRHDDRLARLVLDQQVPDAPARIRVNSGCRLVKDYNPKSYFK